MGEVESAVKHLQQAVRSDPDNSVIRNQYKTMKEIEDNKSKGDDSFKSSNFHEAINNWTTAINLVKDTSPSYSSKIYLNRATALFKLKKYDDAIKDSTKAIYLNRSYVKAYIRRAECYSALGGPENITKAIS
jgi:DnaJ family protein C protein 7